MHIRVLEVNRVNRNSWLKVFRCCSVFVKVSIGSVIFMGLAKAENMPEALSKFAVPKSRCAPTVDGRMLTSVGVIYKDEQHKGYEVVSDVKLGATPINSLAFFSSPSLSIYNEECTIIWKRSYSDLDEIGFNTVKAAGRVFLQVAGETIFNPADDQFVADELLVPSWGSMQSITPFELESSRLKKTSIGIISSTQELFISVTLNNYAKPSYNFKFKRAEFTLLYKLKEFSDGNGNVIEAFSGPDILNARQTKLTEGYRIFKLPNFPLEKYLSGK